MKQIADPLKLKFATPKDAIIFGVCQSQGARMTQEDAWGHVDDEAFVLADGVGGLPHGDIAAKTAVDAALWGFKHIRQRPFYRDDKRLFIKRIFRTANLSVWQERLRIAKDTGMATTLLVYTVGTRRFWMGHAGDGGAFIHHQGILTELTHPDRDAQGYLTKALGTARLGLIPEYATGDLLLGDTMFLTTDGVRDVLDVHTLQRLVGKSGESNVALTEIAAEIIQKAQDQGATDNMTVVLVRRVAYTSEFSDIPLVVP